MTENIHASCIALNRRGIMLIGSSGSGKSDLCLRLIADKGAVLVTDDRTDISAENGRLYASAPSAIKGLLEVRGVGILRFPVLEKAEISLVVSLTANREDVERLPAQEYWEFSGLRLPLLRLCAFEASAPLKIIAALNNLS